MPRKRPGAKVSLSRLSVGTDIASQSIAAKASMGRALSDGKCAIAMFLILIIFSTNELFGGGFPC